MLLGRWGKDDGGGGEQGKLEAHAPRLFGIEIGVRVGLYLRSVWHRPLVSRSQYLWN